MLTILGILIIWTWGFTPLWVNILGTILLVFRACIKFGMLFLEVASENDQIEEYEIDEK